MLENTGSIGYKCVGETELMPDLSLITSLFRSNRYIANYASYVVGVAETLKIEGISFEIIIVANDATRREKHHIQQLSSEISNAGTATVIPISVQRERLYASWNRGVRASSGEVVGFWNVDDMRNTDALIEGVRIIQKGADFVYFPFVKLSFLYLRKIYRIMPQGLLNRLQHLRFHFISPPEFDQKEFTRSMRCGPFFLFSRNLYEKVGNFDEQFHIVGDFEWCVRAAKLTEFHLCRNTGGIFIHDGRGLSARADQRHVVENNVVYLRHGVLDKVEKLQGDQITIMHEYHIDWPSVRHGESEVSSESNN